VLCGAMNKSPSEMARRRKFWLAGGFVVAAVAEYLILTRFLRLPTSSKSPVALLLGSLSLIGGALWLALFVRAKIADPVRKSYVLVSMGLLPVLAGIALLAWVADRLQLMLVFGTALAGSVPLSILLGIWSRRRAHRR
jgi:lipid-A-disaccharide synthase-like uncharacterized protein